MTKRNIQNFKNLSIDLPVIILAGGKGTRLQSVVPDVPKILAPIGKVRFLDVILSWLKHQKVQRLIFSLGYQSELVIRALSSITDNHGMTIDSVVESEMLGTLGGLSYTLNEKSINECLVLNGDTFIDINLYQFLQQQRSRKYQMSLISTHVDDVSRYGQVEFQDDCFVKSFTEKKHSKNATGWINAGIYYFSNSSVQQIKQFKKGSIELDYLTNNCHNLSYYKVKNKSFIDIGTPESYHRAEYILKDFL